MKNLRNVRGIRALAENTVQNQADAKRRAFRVATGVKAGRPAISADAIGAVTAIRADSV